MADLIAELRAKLTGARIKSQDYRSYDVESAEREVVAWSAVDAAVAALEAERAQVRKLIAQLRDQASFADHEIAVWLRETARRIERALKDPT